MATPLTPTPPNPLSAPAKLGRRAAIGAGLTALAATAVIATTPSAAFAQDDQITSDNAWIPEQVRATAAWETTQGKGITVAVMDTGISEHPFFEGKDILPGYTVFPDETDGWGDTDGHGSAVAAGVLLTAPEATIMPIRMDTGSGGFGGTSGSSDYEAFRWAVDNGADVLVVPWGITGAGFQGEDIEVLQYVIDKGAIIVASAGNEPGEMVPYPGLVDGVVTVTGTNRNGDIWYENTTTGPEVELAAPSDEMTVPLPQDSALGNTELTGSAYGGTSMGSGIVGGVAALTWSAHPDLDANNVIQRMIQTAGNGSGERADDIGYGLVNADQAVHAEGIEPVTENPLGYPMGEAGASGVTPDDEEGAGVPEPGEESSAPSGGPGTAGASGNKESNLSAIIVVAAAVVLVAAAIAVWLVLRGRSRKAAAPADQQQAFNQAPGPVPGGFQQAPLNQPQQQYGPPPGQAPGQGSGFGPPPTGQPGGYSSPPPAPQGYTPPPVPGESPPWPSSDPNRR